MKDIDKRVLLVTSEFPPEPGGIGNHSFNLARQLSLCEYDVTVIADQRSKNNNEEKVFDKEQSFRIHRVALKKQRVFMYFNRLKALGINIKTADTIIASGKFSLWSVAAFSILFERRFLAVVHGSELNLPNRLSRFFINNSLKKFESIIAVSNFTKGLIRVPNLNIQVIPNGYDENNFIQKFKEIKISGYPKLITVGNVTSRKGQLNVIRHLPKLKEVYPDIHYHCVGLLTEADEFKNKAKRLGVEQNVTFHGMVDSNKLGSLLTASDIFVMLSQETSTGDVEGFGIAVIEANALGLPAIGAKNTGLEDAIKNGSTGFIINPHNFEDFLDCINSILKDYDSFSKASLNWSNNYKWSETIKAYLKVIETE